MRNTTKLVNFKDFESELRIIDFFDSLKSVSISISKENKFDTQARISKKDTKLILEINNRDLLSIQHEETVNNVKAVISNKELFIDSLTIDRFHVNINDEGVFNEMICSFSILRNSQFENDYSSIFKCFIPTNHSRLNTFHFQFETVTYQDKKKEYLYDCVRFEIKNILFDLTQVKIDNKGYFVIEAKQEVRFEDFCDYCFATRQALGFITGYMPGDEEFYFSQELDYYYTNSLRPSIDSMYYPINTNPYSVLYDKKDIAEKYLTKLNVLPSTIFSRLATELFNVQELSSSVILLLEASSIRSLLIIPSVFAVIIETLSKIISEKETGFLLPIDDKELSKKIIKELNLIVDSYSEQLSPEGHIKLKRRINGINRPINKEKLTNNEKLTRPFEQLGILLTIEDINAIEHRNDLLHGNILLTNGINEDDDSINNYMNYVSSKLYTLISSLILKYVGYTGHVINHAKFHENLCNLETDEEYYKFI